METIDYQEAYEVLSSVRPMNFQTFKVKISELKKKGVVTKAGVKLLTRDKFMAYVEDIIERQGIEKAQWVPPGFAG